MVNHLFDIVENPSLTRQQKRDAIVQLCDMANKSPKVLASQAIIETAIDWLKVPVTMKQRCIYPPDIQPRMQSEDNAAVFEYAQFVIETMAVVDKGVFLTCFQFTNNAKPAELAKLTVKINDRIPLCKQTVRVHDSKKMQSRFCGWGAASYEATMVLHFHCVVFPTCRIQPWPTSRQCPTWSCR